MRNSTLHTGAIAGLVLTLGAGSTFAGTTALPAGLALNPSTSSNRGFVVRAFQAPAGTAVDNNFVRALAQINGTLKDVTGTLIANDLGLTMSTILNPGSNAAAPITSTLLYWLGAVTFFGLDIHHWVLAFFIRTYSVLPMGAAHGSEDLMRNVLAHTGWILSAGVQVAAPIMAVAFLVTWVFSMLGRAVPQMNVFSESMPIRVLSGLFILAMSMRFIGDHTANFLRRIPDDFVRIAQILGNTPPNP